MVIRRVEDDWDYTDWSIDTKIEFDVNVCYTTDKNDTRYSIIASPLYLGKFGSKAGFIQDTDLWVTRATLQWSGSDANVSWWNSVISVSSVPPFSFEAGDNPLLRAPRVVRIVNARESIASIIDHRGRATANSAGDYFGGFEIEIPIRKFVYSGNYSSVPSWMMFLDGTVNAVELNIKGLNIPIGCGKLFIEETPLEQQKENGISYYPIAYEIHYNPDGWQSLIFNRGLMEIKYLDKFGTEVSPNATPGASAGQLYESKKVAILDENGDPVKQPVFLDAWGRKILKPKMRTTAVGTAVTTKGSNYITALDFSVIEKDVGSAVGFRSPTSGRIFVTEVTSHGNGTLFAVKDVVNFSTSLGSPSDVFLPGVCTISLARCPFANWEYYGVKV